MCCPRFLLVTTASSTQSSANTSYSLKQRCPRAAAGDVPASRLRPKPTNKGFGQ